METFLLRKTKTGTVTLRPYDVTRDIPNEVSATNANFDHVGLEFHYSVEERENEWRHLVNCVPHEDWIVAEVDGMFAGCAGVNWYIADEGEQIFRFSGEIFPRFQTPEIGGALLNWQEARARQLARSNPYPGPSYTQTGAFTNEGFMTRLLEQNGYTQSRYVFHMVRDLSQPIPDLVLPSNVFVRAPEQNEVRRVWKACNEAFRDHWNHRDMTETDLDRLENDPAAMPHLWQIVWDKESDEPAGGVHVTIFPEENKHFNLKRGMTDPIWVRRPYRKQGLAKALIARGMNTLKAEGMTEASLFVDTMNPNGALRLYEGMGFREHRKHVVYRKEVRIQNSEGGSEV